MGKFFFCIQTSTFHSRKTAGRDLQSPQTLAISTQSSRIKKEKNEKRSENRPVQQYSMRSRATGREKGEDQRE
jgi:hypothetical protein